MKFGVREICEVVLKAKATQKVGNKTFYKGEPVIYFDTLKTSSLEGAATTVYAQGGRGNSRLVAWEGERTLTFTMEDALISPAGFMILSGAGLVDGTEKAIQVHVAETTDGVYVKDDGIYIVVEQTVSTDDNASIYVMLMKDGEIVTEPFIGKSVLAGTGEGESFKPVVEGIKETDNVIFIPKNAVEVSFDGRPKEDKYKYTATDIADIVSGSVVMVDYYTAKTSGAQQIEITPDKFCGNYYLEASTLFRDTNGVDMPAEFIIPNCKIQSNFTFTMASSGDPSTFTFTMDAFPDYTRFDKTKKVLAAIQIISADGEDDDYRISTKA